MNDDTMGSDCGGCFYYDPGTTDPADIKLSRVVTMETLMQMASWGMDFSYHLKAAHDLVKDYYAEMDKSKVNKKDPNIITFQCFEEGNPQDNYPNAFQILKSML